MYSFATILMVLCGVNAAVFTIPVNSLQDIDFHYLYIFFDISTHQISKVDYGITIGYPGDTFMCKYSNHDNGSGATSSEQGRNEEGERGGEEEEEEEEEERRLSLEHKIFSRCVRASARTRGFLSFSLREPLPQLSLPWTWLPDMMKPKIKGNIMLDMYYTEVEYVHLLLLPYLSYLSEYSINPILLPRFHETMS